MDNSHNQNMAKINAIVDYHNDLIQSKQPIDLEILKSELNSTILTNKKILNNIKSLLSDISYHLKA